MHNYGPEICWKNIFFLNFKFMVLFDFQKYSMFIKVYVYKSLKNRLIERNLLALPKYFFVKYTFSGQRILKNVVKIFEK